MGSDGTGYLACLSCVCLCVLVVVSFCCKTPGCCSEGVSGCAGSAFLSLCGLCVLLVLRLAVSSFVVSVALRRVVLVVGLNLCSRCSVVLFLVVSGCAWGVLLFFSVLLSKKRVCLFKEAVQQHALASSYSCLRLSLSVCPACFLCCSCAVRTCSACARVREWRLGLASVQVS